MKHRIVPFFIAHRGCPHRCVFCDQLKISGSTNQFPNKSEILDTVSAYRNSGGGKAVEVAFFGGSFTCLSRADQEQLLMPLQPLMAAGEVSSVRVSTRPDVVDYRIAAFLKGMGVATVELGVQSMADDVLLLSGRGHGSEEVRKAVSCLQDSGLRVGLQLMPGLPGDTPEKSLDSLHDVLVLKPDFLRIYPALVIVGTELEKMYEKGSYRPMTLGRAVALCKIMLHEALLSDIPVIRMGLQPTAELQSEGIIVAGPYHPAFRQLVEGDLWFDLLVRLTSTPGLAEEPFTIVCSPSRVSDVIGQRKTNLRRLSRRCGMPVAAVKADPVLSPWELRIAFNGGERTGNIMRDLRYPREVIAHV
jgi:histone acetyltransferase (RNA polymerase elongator complex component)